MMVAYITQINAYYAWATALVASGTEAANMAKALQDTAAQIGVECGLLFTSFLVALYFPALAVLRRRGRALVRAVKPRLSMGEQRTWLSDRSMAFSVPDYVTQGIALIAPAAAGTAAQLFGILK